MARHNDRAALITGASRGLGLALARELASRGWRLIVDARAAAAQERARAELAAVGLADRFDHYPAQLSGGEQQRVAVARALAPNPAIIVADEPTGNLDEDTGKQIIELLFAGHAERKSTLVLVTHDAALAARCSRVVRMRSGRIDGVSG